MRNNLPADRDFLSLSGFINEINRMESVLSLEVLAFNIMSCVGLILRAVITSSGVAFLTVLSYCLVTVVVQRIS